MAWRISSASVCMFGLHFTSAARLSRLPVAVGGTAFVSPLEPQPASVSAAAAPIISRVNLIRSSGPGGPSMPQSLRIRLPRAVRSNPAPGWVRMCEGEPVNQDWEDRVAAAWATFDDYPEERAHEFRAVIDELVAELPDGSPLGPFERACAWDSTGHSDKAAPLYREALARGLGEASRYKGRRAKIQLSSSL